MTDLPFHVDASRRFKLFMWKMSSYDRFTLWMRPDGGPIDKSRDSDEMIRAGDLVKVNSCIRTAGAPAGLRGREAAHANALALLLLAGYQPGMSAAETHQRIVEARRKVQVRRSLLLAEVLDTLERLACDDVSPRAILQDALGDESYIAGSPLQTCVCKAALQGQLDVLRRAVGIPPGDTTALPDEIDADLVAELERAFEAEISESDINENCP